MKYIFCIIALLIQPIFSWYVYHKQDKRDAALKLPMLFYSVLYLIIQTYVFVKFCLKFPEEYQKYSYLIQLAILLIFLVLELALFRSNKYITDVQQREQDSVREFKDLIQELEICKINVSDMDMKKLLDELLEKMRYSDPVSSPTVKEENQKIHDLIIEISAVTEKNLFTQKCNEIARQIEKRKIKNAKERG